MTSVKCYYENGDIVITRINLSFKEAEEYFLNNIFNIGSVEDNLQKCIKIEEV